MLLSRPQQLLSLLKACFSLDLSLNQPIQGLCLAADNTGNLFPRFWKDHDLERNTSQASTAYDDELCLGAVYVSHPCAPTGVTLLRAHSQQSLGSLKHLGSMLMNTAWSFVVSHSRSFR